MTITGHGQSGDARFFMEWEKPVKTKAAEVKGRHLLSGFWCIAHQTSGPAPLPQNLPTRKPPKGSIMQDANRAVAIAEHNTANTIPQTEGRTPLVRTKTNTFSRLVKKRLKCLLDYIAIRIQQFTALHCSIIRQCCIGNCALLNSHD
jgi:hypothetical protein